MPERDDVPQRALVLVVRPTPSGVDERSLRAVVRAVAERAGGPVLAAHLDQGEPSVHDVLDRLDANGASTAVLVPLALPDDRYLASWLAKAVANWRETRAGALDVRMARGPAAATGLAEAIAGLADETAPITASPAGFRSPSWSVLDVPDRHLFVCRGPRCTAHGAGPVHRALADLVRGTTAKVTPAGCFGPCNLGPLVIDHPGGTWHQHVDADGAAKLLDRRTGRRAGGAGCR
ncbi:(2Fe-2S) ferredoxin domain-containing protein [Saccharopolyspora gregorii]|uniref:(2Fe-2S) ferredoxin domain-containing protein n=1 Tax=Saccharopolyspora gregorii TaxID=33914 RepID=A0ABP6RRH3_9PSEU|nr:(2Fe-2S) ferredoxin domain-containing protein [Saccharopolyspora gregorii]